MAAELTAVLRMPDTATTTGVAPDLDAAAEHMAAVLRALGFDLTRDGVRRTPWRFVSALHELAAGRQVDPRRHLEVTFPSEGDAAVTVEQIPVIALCEHHSLPFTGVISISYLPAEGQRIVGLSKLARLAEEFAARWTVQERITREIADAIEECLDVRGVAVLVRARHSCMSDRGARAHGAWTVTDVYRGAFETDVTLRLGFRLSALGGRPTEMGE